MRQLATNPKMQVVHVLETLWHAVKEHPVLIVSGLIFLQLARTKYRDGLRQIPGPFLASFSNLWKLNAAWHQNMHRENLRVHEDYGDIVRIGPNHVSLADPQSMRTIYGVTNVFPKVRFSVLLSPSCHQSIIFLRPPGNINMLMNKTPSSRLSTPLPRLSSMAGSCRTCSPLRAMTITCA